MPDDGEVSREEFEGYLAAPVEDPPLPHAAADRILAIVTTPGRAAEDPRKRGAAGRPCRRRQRASRHLLRPAGFASVAGWRLGNPYFEQRGPFRHPDFPLDLVARLAAYFFADVRAMINRALVARNRGLAVIDLRGGWMDEGGRWLKAAAERLPPQRVPLEQTRAPAAGPFEVIPGASFGSNDSARRRRHSGFRFLPGAPVTELVFTGERTFREPPPGWDYGDWKRPETHFAGSPQALAADWVRYGATATTGHVYEPYLHVSPYPQIQPPQRLAGRTLAESFHPSVPALSWMNVLPGDPLCRLAPG